MLPAGWIQDEDGCGGSAPPLKEPQHAVQASRANEGAEGCPGMGRFSLASCKSCGRESPHEAQMMCAGHEWRVLGTATVRTGGAETALTRGEALRHLGP